MAIGVKWTCSVCGDEVYSEVLRNYDGMFRIADGSGDYEKFDMCPSCADEVHEFVLKLREENDYAN